MGKLKLGTRIAWKERYIKFNLGDVNFECHVKPDGTLDDTYDACVQLSLLAAIGHPVYGKVVGYGFMGCYKVKFKCGSLSYSEYLERKNFEVLA